MKKFVYLFISALTCFSLTACDLTAEDVHDIVDIIMNDDETVQDDTPQVNEEDIIEDDEVENEEDNIEEEEQPELPDEVEPTLPDDTEPEQPQVEEGYSNVHEYLQDIVDYYNYEDPDFNAYYEYFETDDYIWFEITDEHNTWDAYDYEANNNPQAALDTHDELMQIFNSEIIQQARNLGFNGDIDITVSASDGMKIYFFSASAGSQSIDYSDIYITHGVNSNSEYYLYPVANTCYWDDQSGEYVYIGTITFYDPATGIYGAMGHYADGINYNSYVYEALVREISVVTDEDDSYQAITDIEYVDNIVFGNTFYTGNYGIYGNYTNGEGWIDQQYPVAWKDEVYVGQASFFSEAPNMNDDCIYNYTIEITAVYEDHFDFIITDSAMIESGVGLAQGMSGSPIMQDGHIVGALSGLYCTESNVETYGYGVYVEDMLYEAGILN